MTSLLTGLWTKIEGGFQTLKGSSVSLSSLAADLKLDTKRTNSKKQKKSVSDEQLEVEDALYTLKVAVMKYKKLWNMIDCRKLVNREYLDVSDYFIEIGDTVVSLSDDQGFLGEFERLCTTIAVDSIHVVQSIVTWVTSDIYIKGKEMKDFDYGDNKNKNKSENENENENENKKMITNTPDSKKKYIDNKSNNDENDKANDNDNDDDNDNENYKNEMDLELSDSSDIVLNIREKLLDVLLTWMTLGDENNQESDSRDVRTMHRALQREAFSMVGTLRALYPMKSRTYRYVDCLAFVPSQGLLAGLRRVFELEGGRIREDMRRCEEIIALHDESMQGGKGNNNTHTSSSSSSSSKAVHEVEKHTDLLVNYLLLPLSNSMMFDIENLNRRQAAAVLCYYLDPSVTVQEAVSGLIKCLKERDIVKYLEVQMVALKSFYTDNVVNKLKEKLTLEEDSGLEDYLEAEKNASQVYS